MTLHAITDRQTGVRTLTTAGPSEKELAAEARARGHAHHAALAEARASGTPNPTTAQPLWTPPPPAKLVVEDEAALRSALANALSALADARDAELRTAARVSTADRERIAASHRHTAAVAATATARDQAADAMKLFLTSEDGDRPSSGAYSAAVAIEHAAALDVSVMDAALAGLKVEHEASIAATMSSLREAEGLRDRIVLAVASAMAGELVEADERALELRRSLSELFAVMPVSIVRPAGVIEAMTPKNIPFHTTGHTPGSMRFAKLRTDLMSDALATVAPLGD